MKNVLFCLIIFILYSCKTYSNEDMHDKNYEKCKKYTKLERYHKINTKKQNSNIKLSKKISSTTNQKFPF